MTLMSEECTTCERSPENVYFFRCTRQDTALCRRLQATLSGIFHIPEYCHSFFDVTRHGSVRLFPLLQEVFLSAYASTFPLFSQNLYFIIYHTGRVEQRFL